MTQEGYHERNQNPAQKLENMLKHFKVKNVEAFVAAYERFPAGERRKALEGLAAKIWDKLKNDLFYVNEVQDLGREYLNYGRGGLRMWEAAFIKSFADLNLNAVVHYEQQLTQYQRIVTEILDFAADFNEQFVERREGNPINMEGITRKEIKQTSWVGIAVRSLALILPELEEMTIEAPGTLKIVEEGQNIIVTSIEIYDDPDAEHGRTFSDEEFNNLGEIPIHVHHRNVSEEFRDTPSYGDIGNAVDSPPMINPETGMEDLFRRRFGIITVVPGRVYGTSRVTLQLFEIDIRKLRESIKNSHVDLTQCLTYLGPPMDLKKIAKGR